MTSGTAGIDPAIEAAVEEAVSRAAAEPLGGATIPAAETERLVARFGLGSTTALALAALPVARRIARPPISGYRVGVVGIEAETGDLVLGGNLEFPGTELSTTVHAEGFVTLRARRRGHTLATLALRAAHPCAHCRQVLSEAAAADGLVLVDTEGARLRLDDVYPWPFRPAALELPGDAPRRTNWPALAIARGAAMPDDITTVLLEAGRLAHAPYSGAPSAAVLRTRAGRVVSAGCMESVAFNPSLSALQAAIVELIAAGIEPADIVEGWLGATIDGAVDPEPGFRSLLGAVAPDASISVVRWRPAA